MEIFKTARIYNFMGKKVPLLAVSTILVILSCISLYTKGLNFSNFIFCIFGYKRFKFWY